MTSQELNEYVEKFVLEERERCAVLCETYGKKTSEYYLSRDFDEAEYWAGETFGASQCAHLIRIES